MRRATQIYVARYTNAASSASGAAASFDAFDDRFLGVKAADPTLDNDGNALLAGALYFSSSAGKIRLYTGSAWQDVAPTATSLAASAVTVTPTGGIAATTAQAALAELDTEKVPSTRTVSAGAGLSGGGDLSANRTLSVPNDGITNALLANMVANTIKGNNTGGTADPLDLTSAQVKTMLNLAGTNNGDQTITLTGDVTGSGTGSLAATVADDAVTNAKLANMAANTIKGNNAGATGDPLDLTPTQVAAMLPAGANDAVKVSAADTTAGNLTAKLVAGLGISSNILAPGGNEQFNLAFAPSELPSAGSIAGTDEVVVRSIASGPQRITRDELLTGYAEVAPAQVDSGAALTLQALGSGNTQRVRLTANATVTLPAGPATANREVSLAVELVQDSTGNRTVTWATQAGDTIKWDGGSAPAIATGANQETHLLFRKRSGLATWFGSRIWGEA